VHDPRDDDGAEAGDREEPESEQDTLDLGLRHARSLLPSPAAHGALEREIAPVHTG
jgi:hypothetical protein